MTKKRIFSFFALMAGIVLSASALQITPTAYLRVIDNGQGLPDNSVNDIAEDRYGFIWIATWNGLARFDGKTMTVYRHTDEKESIGDNLVRCLLTTDDGIWAGSENGLDFMRFSDSRIFKSYVKEENMLETPLTSRVSRVLNLGGSIIALTINGDMLRLDESISAGDGTHNVFRVIPRPLGRRYSDIAPFTSGRILALSNEGVTCLSGNGNNEIYHNRINAFFDPNMNLNCDTVRGLVTIGGGIGSVSASYTIDSRGAMVPLADYQAVFNMMSMTRDGENVYIGTDGNGLYVENGGTTTHLTHYNSALPGDAIYKLYVDSRHNLWIGTYRSGLCLLSRDLNRYTVDNMSTGTLGYDIVTAAVDDGERMYLGLDGGGVEIIDRSDYRHTTYNSRNSALPGNNVVSLVKDGNMLWAAVYAAGLVSLDIPSGRITTYRVDAEYEPGNKLWTLLDDGAGHLWVGGSSLQVFDKSRHTFEPVDECREVTVMSLADDGRNIWVATGSNGVLLIDKETRRVIERFSDVPTSGGVQLPGNSVNYIYLDTQRILWMAMNNRILCRVNLAGGTKTCEIFAGLNDCKVNTMVEDDRGNILIGTDHGLVKYLRHNDAIVRLSDSRMPATFTPNSGMRSGSIACFGTTSGLLRYPLDQPETDSIVPKLLFTGIDVFDNQSTKIALCAGSGRAVELKDGQNFFKVSFTVPEMSNPDKLSFECRLDGLESVWRDVSESRSATYTNVPAGTYRMLVRHTMPDGSWSHPATLDITVRPAWYATVPMIVVWILLALLFIAFAVRVSYVSIRNRQQMRKAEIERDAAVRLNEAKLEFYASISHELRTPCFLISAQIEEMIDSGRQTVPVSGLTGIYRNSAKLNKLLGHIIDFRKNEAGQLRLMPRPTELVGFLGILAEDYAQLCRQKSQTFTYEHDITPIEADIDRDKLEQMVTNLVSNAYKFTPKGGAVTLAVAVKGDAVQISVSDTGIGIADKLLTQIFEPYTNDEEPSRHRSGDGIGLAYVKKLVDLHNGTITVESRSNEGAKFTITLPLTQAGRCAADDDDRSGRHVAPSEPRKEPETIDNPTSTHSILLVDDNADVLSAISHAFEGEYRVTRVSDASEAMTLARRDGFDVVIMDLMSHGTDGHRLIRALKADKATSDIKIVVLSALTSESDILTALDEGADSYLTKPMSLKVLRRHIERMFDRGDAAAVMSGKKQPAGTYNREEQKFLLECRRIIEECMTDDNFGIEMLARRLAMSHSSLYKKIRRMTGLSLIDFINEYRIYKAVALFRDGNGNVQKVAEMCGFRDIKTFRETFKRKMQMPPKQYIQSLK